MAAQNLLRLEIRLQEVADEITIVRTHGLQLSDLIQEGWGNSGTEALAAAISDVRSMRAEVCAHSHHLLMQTIKCVIII